MRRAWSCVIALCFASIATAGDADMYTLGFSGPDTLTGAEGASVEDNYLVTLDHQGPGPGAQGWSIGVELVGGSVTSATTDGTSTADVFDGGFDKTAVIDPELNGGRQGAVSAVVLCFGCPAVVPPSATLLDVGVSVDVGADDSTASLGIVSGLIGDGQPVQVVVTQEGTSAPWEAIGKEIAVVVKRTCLGRDGFALGFSTDRMLATEAFAEGIIGTSEDIHENSLVVRAAAGETPSQDVYVNVVSNAPEGAAGIQGWSLSVEAVGDAVITDITVENTSGAPVPDGRFDGGFGRTELAPAENNDGRAGAVTANVLCFGCPASLEPVSTESVARVVVQSAAPLADGAPQSGAIFFSPLRGSGQVVENILTQEGNSVEICNLQTGRLSLEFDLVLGKGPFIRGDANDDGGVNIADGIWILNELFRDGAPSPCQSAADANGDLGVSIADATYIFSYRFAGGDEPPAPFPECGVIDLDADDLVCDNGNSSCL